MVQRSVYSQAEVPGDGSLPGSWIVDAGFAALLLVCGVRYFAVHVFNFTGVLVLVLGLLAGVAYMVGVVGHPRAQRRRVGILAATAVWFPLVLLAPSFSWAAFALFFAVHRVLPRRVAQWITAAIVAAVCIGLYILSHGEDLGLVLGPLLGGIVLSIVYAQLNRAFEQRNALIDELVATQAQLAEREREAGALTERTRVANELHDTVVQQTASALILLEAAATQSMPRTDQGAEHISNVDTAQQQLGEAREVLRQSLTETRQLMHGLTLPRTPGRSLPHELSELAAANQADFALVGEAVALNDDTEHALLRVAQEALVNVRKHAAASHARITLTYFDDAIALDIADDGKGFQFHPAEPASSGYGLRAMAWRIESLGGAFNVETRPGGGTVVTGQVPLERPQNTSDTSLQGAST